jgi:aminopeptidase YwaD
LLTDYASDLGIEIVALNGEDYYAAPGQLQYLSRNEGRFEEIVLGVNLDGVGYHRGRTAYSLYGCPPALADPIHAAFDAYNTQIEGEPWYQGDHGIFLMHERPTLAMTSERLTEIMTEIVHTARDRPEIVAADQLVDSARALRDLVQKLSS